MGYNYYLVSKETSEYIKSVQKRIGEINEKIGLFDEDFPNIINVYKHEISFDWTELDEVKHIGKTSLGKNSIEFLWNMIPDEINKSYSEYEILGECDKIFTHDEFSKRIKNTIYNFSYMEKDGRKFF